MLGEKVSREMDRGDFQNKLYSCGCFAQNLFS